MSWTEIVALTSAASTILYSLFRWSDLVENRKTRKVLREKNEQQETFNVFVAKAQSDIARILEDITPKG